MKHLTRYLWLAVGLSHWSALSLMAEEPVLSATRQATFFRQIFHYDDRLNDAGEIFVLLLESKSEAASQVDLVRAFNEVGVTATAVVVTELAEPVDPATVVYVSPGSDLSSVKQFCSEKGILSISGDPSLAENGDVSIGLRHKGGSPEIIVNRTRLKAEKHKLSSHLLKLAKLIE